MKKLPLIAIILLAFTGLPFASYAQDEESTPYSAKDTTDSVKKMRTMHLPIAPPPSKEKPKTEGEAEADSESPPKTAQEDIWEKYKKLAEGTPGKKEAAQEDEETKSSKGENAKDQEDAEENNLMGILEAYKKKTQGGAKMHSRSLSSSESKKQ
ncbi:MAG: hypothetical protein KDI13_02250 [Alphaproteobacteria bacterium]|nr:hypothetical protein [Alphaproteobacteria bacterium]